MDVQNEVDEKSIWDTFQEDVRIELEQSQRSLKEISMMLDQSQAELTKLAQRNSAITVHLQQVQAQIDTVPRPDIRMAYDAALDAQHRLFVMRGQLEKLQSDQTNLQRYIGFLDRAQQIVIGPKPAPQVKSASDIATVEMLINAQEAERQRLSRQMHDGPAQALSNFILQTEIALRLFEIDQGRARDELNNLKSSAMATFQKVRNYIFDLRPMMLDDLGLIPTVKRYGDSIHEQGGVDVTVLVSGMERRLEPYLEVMIFRALQEIMGTATRVNQASQIKVHLSLEDVLVRVVVEDNGKALPPGYIEDPDSLGMKLIKERVEMLGGNIEFEPGVTQGNRITFQAPTTRNSGGISS
jgi:two-component system sensor histidine kinase DegS